MDDDDDDDDDDGNKQEWKLYLLLHPFCRCPDNSLLLEATAPRSILDRIQPNCQRGIREKNELPAILRFAVPFGFHSSGCPHTSTAKSTDNTQTMVEFSLLRVGRESFLKASVVLCFIGVVLLCGREKSTRIFKV
jgi:hypothetical protein